MAASSSETSTWVTGITELLLWVGSTRGLFSAGVIFAFVPMSRRKPLVLQDDEDPGAVSGAWMLYVVLVMLFVESLVGLMVVWVRSSKVCSVITVF
jgi:hypothetical protein